MILFIIPIKKGLETILEEIYKNVFSGKPWYEDYACKYCKALYTDKRILPEFSFSATKIERGLVKCVKCGNKLELVSYYPDVIDQRKLISEAIEFESFIGYMLFNKDLPIGFSWGYKIPTQRTQSVNFPLVRPLLEKSCISCERSFYGAETGVIEEYQNKGLGSAISAARALGAYKNDYEFFTIRTINPAMRKINQNLFSEKEQKSLFDDPETGSPWLSWEFKDFDLKYATEKLRSAKCRT